MTFIDLKTGNFYDCGLHKKNEKAIFVNWFDGAQSVNIIYPQRFVYLSQTQAEDTFYLPKDSAFFFYKLNQQNKTQIDGVDYYNFEKNVDGNYTKITSDLFEDLTISHNNTTYYVKTFVVCACSKDAGSITDDIIIGTPNSNNDVITIGADFYIEEETLTSNLENFGIEIPSIIQKAFFDTNIHEDLNDNIILNRKRKELLLNYWEIIANKGSYISLVNSLKWFEYGDLLQLREYWKRIYDHCEFFDPQNIDELTGNIIASNIKKMSRTTYIGIYLALNKLTSGYDKETNPITQDIDSEILKWSKEDLSLKMTLLGNFYSTYMMPIHLDLLHSTLERIVFSYAFNIYNGSAMRRRDNIYYSFPAAVSISDSDGKNKDRDQYYLEYTDAYVYHDTIFGKTDTAIGLNEDALILNGYEPLRDNNDDKDNNAIGSITASKWFNNIGKLIRFDVKIKKKYCINGDAIFKSDMYINDSHSISYSPIDISWLEPNENDTIVDEYVYFHFWLLFRETNTYNISCVFNSLYGKSYSFDKTIHISDTTNNIIKTYIVNRQDSNIITSITTHPYFNENINNYCFNIADQQSENNTYYYNQDIIYSLINADKDYPGVNHVIRFVLETGKSYILTDTTHTYTLNSSSITNQTTAQTCINTLSSNSYFNNYWWDFSKTYTTGDELELSNELWVLRGIRKLFTTLDNLDTKVKVTYQDNTAINRIFDKDCFLPGLHTLVELEEPCKIKKNQLIAVKPLISKSLSININDNPDKYNWVQKNLTTGTIHPIGTLNNSPCEPFLIQTDEPGYYQIIFNYTLDNTVNTEICSSSYLIMK